MQEKKKALNITIKYFDFYFKGKLNAIPKSSSLPGSIACRASFVLLFFWETNGSLKWTQEAIEEVGLMHTSSWMESDFLTTDYLNIGIQHICPLLQKLKYFPQSLP